MFIIDIAKLFSVVLNFFFLFCSSRPKSEYTELDEDNCKLKDFSVYTFLAFS